MGVFLKTLFFWYLKIIPEQFGLVKLIIHVKGLAAQLMLPGYPINSTSAECQYPKRNFSFRYLTDMEFNCSGIHLS